MAVLLGKLLPLYLFVALGFVASRWLAVRKEALAPLLIYMLTPLVVLRGVTAVELDAARLALPFIVFSSCTLICLVALQLASLSFPSPAKNILAFAAGNSNSGYFGLPVAVALLGESAFPQAVMISFGFILYENTVGFYVSARGRGTSREALKKVLTLPTAYAFLLGITLRLLHVEIGGGAAEILTAVRGAYTVLGMMLLGLALGDLRAFRMDGRFLGFALSMKFVVWPLLVITLVAVDHATLHLFDRLARQGLAVAALLPLAANTVAIATLHDAEPDKASLAVLVSTVIAIGLFPVLGAFVLAIG